ncbi:MAG: D-TA family PLP-dependent enzyme [Bacteroidota bacterium]
MSLNHIYQIKDRERILSPALIFYPELIKRNIQRMIKIAGSTKRLRPHIKTFKCKEIVQLQMEAGIRHFKCASLEEARLLAELKIPEALVAYPLTGPAQLEFLNLSNTFQDTQFSVLIDHEDQVQQWKRYTDASISVFIDLDVGMHRTGIDPNSAMALYDSLDSRFNFRGFHVYDGHIHTSSLEVRTQEVEAAFTKVIPLLASFESKQALEIICGGSASFPIHAQDPMRTVSPGTTLLWDQGYTSSFPDLPLEIAAVCLCRVISKPQPDLLCVDLGHKAVASEMKEMPVHFQQIPDAQMASISEEHLVLRTDAASKFKIGDVLYGFPWHICPTVALHESALIIEDQTIQEQWMISARKRKYLL